MGFFRRLGKVVEGALDLTDESSGGIGPVADRPPVAPLPGASTLVLLQALAQTSGGRAGRAIVQSTDGVTTLEGHAAVRGSCTVQMILRARELDGGFGPRIEKHVLLPVAAGLLIGAGLEVPITRDPRTGALVGVDRDALIDELRPRFAEAIEAEKARSQLGLGYAVGAIRDGVAELLHPPPTDSAPTVEGVAADQWLQVRRVLQTGRIPAAVLDRTLAAYGIPQGRWPRIDAVWSSRADADPALADRLAEL